ncbi:MAG: MBL fold metallo-hydrolase [Myxococcota bacterium]
MRRILLLACLVVVGLLLVAGLYRRTVALRIYGLIQGSPPLSEAIAETPDVEWADEYFTLQRIDPRTIAIGEPRYAQQNYSYLILGESRAILFDSGPGVRDITPIVQSQTSLPVTVVASHFHYDHVGNHARFERVALPDLPGLRERAQGGVLSLRDEEHLGFLEGQSAPDLKVTEWWAPGATIDLGGRELQVIHAPGHTPDSIVLYDPDAHQLFAGDFIYPGELYAFLPGSSLRDYLATANTLLDFLPRNCRILTAHRSKPPRAPVLLYEDLLDLRALLQGIHDGSAEGEGFFPQLYRANFRVTLLTDIVWLEDWD